MKKINQLFLLTFILFGIFLTKVSASEVVAKIGNTTYETLDDAILAVEDDETIELLQDTKLTKVTAIDKNITINGNSHSINISSLPSDDGRLSLRATLTLNNTIIEHNNTTTNSNAWGLYLASNAILNLNDSYYTIQTHGVYASPKATINLNHSTMTAKDMNYTAFMQGDESNNYAYLNLTNRAQLRIDNITSTTGNGTNWFSISADNSEIFVTNCARQGFVGGRLELKNNSTANYLNNQIAFTLYQYDYIRINEGTTLNVNNNSSVGIWQYGGEIKVAKNANLEMTQNGKQRAIDTTNYNGAVINSTNYYQNATITFEDGANVAINDNYLRAIRNSGVAYIGSNTEIMNNGLVTEEGKMIPQYGGGVYNDGMMTINSNVKLYNNHARLAGDDIYSRSTVTFSKVGEDWLLDDCNDKINGWYDDSLDNRWEAHDTNNIHVELTDPNTYEGELALKAAHDNIGKVIINYVDTDGNVLTDEIILTGEVGKNYLTEEKKFDGYVFVKVEGNKEGVFDFENTYVTYYYTKYTATGDVEVIPPKTGVGEESSKMPLQIKLDLSKKEDE